MSEQTLPSAKPDDQPIEAGGGGGDQGPFVPRGPALGRDSAVAGHGAGRAPRGGLGCALSADRP